MLLCGIDLGTTAIKAVIVEVADNGRTHVLASSSKATNAYSSFDSENESNKKEQNVSLILSSLLDVLNELPKPYLDNIQALTFADQMHGVVLFNERGHSPLFTWEDHRCSEARLAAINQVGSSQGCSQVHQGYGIVSLDDYFSNNTSNEFHYVNTIGGYIVYLLTDRNVISPSDAASIGFFDIKLNKWNSEAINALNESILPLLPNPISDSVSAKYAFTSVSTFASLLRGIVKKEQVQIYPCIGDHCAGINYWCSPLQSSETSDKSFLCINLGTSGQVAIVGHLVNEILELMMKSSVELPPYIEVRPTALKQYPLMLVCASHNGGNLVKEVMDIVATQSGCSIDLSSIYSNSFMLNHPFSVELKIERGLSSADGISFQEGCSMSNVYETVVEKVVNHLLALIPSSWWELLSQHARKVSVRSIGTVFSKSNHANTVLSKWLTKYQLSDVLSSDEEDLSFVTAIGSTYCALR
jgi:FGGY family of carbohydrate kinases, N-terminal domain